MRGLFLRDVPVQLLDLSLSGCLLRSTGDLSPGTSGELRVMMGGSVYRETLQVIRSIEQQGSGHAHLVGGEFSWTTGPAPDTVRGKVRSIVPHTDL